MTTDEIIELVNASKFVVYYWHPAEIGIESEIEEVEESIVWQGRWTQTMRSVYRVPADGGFFAVRWERGLTEYQDDGDFPDPVAFRVYPKETTITVYEEQP